MATIDWKADVTAEYKINRSNVMLDGVTYQPGDPLPPSCTAHQDGAMLKRLLDRGLIVRAADFGQPPWRHNR